MSVSALYPGTVVHQRLKPRRHRLRYRVSPMLLDLDELPALDKRLRLFAHNRAGVFSFHDADHGDGERSGLKAWALARLAEADVVLEDGRIALLCYPRMLGYAFNPLSVYFCRHGDGRLAAILYEVNNTLGERHTYVIPAAQDGGRVVRQNCVKRFYVSPFVPMACTYRFRIGPPDEAVLVSIAESDADGPLLSAVFAGTRRQLTDGALARTLMAFPLMTLKVIAGIHYEALKLWLKRIPLAPYAKADRPIGVTIVPAAEAAQP